MVLLGDESLVELCSVRLNIVLHMMQDSCMVCTERTIGLKSFWTHSVRLLGDEAQVEARFSPFVDSATLMQDWCMVCVERTVGSKIVLKAPNGTPR
jgi:hypothetical protein